MFNIAAYFLAAACLLVLYKLFLEIKSASKLKNKGLCSLWFQRKWFQCRVVPAHNTGSGDTPFNSFFPINSSPQIVS